MPDRHIFKTKDTEFNDDLVIQVPYLNTNAGRLNVSNQNLSDLNTLYSNPNVALAQLGWKEIWALHSSPSARTKDVNTELHIRRHQLEVQLRKIFGDIPKSVLTTTDRSTLHLKERDANPTKIQVVQHAPKGSIEAMRHLAHVLRITDPQNPHTQEMPKGNKAEVHQCIQDSGSTAEKVWLPSEHSPASRFLFTVHFTDAQAGKMALYRLRYQNNHGDKGGWSDTFGALIA